MTGRLSLLSTGVDLVDQDHLLALLLQRGPSVTIAHHNLHSLALTEKDRDLQAFYRTADVVFIDGMPIVWLLKARGERAEPRHRNTGLDWLPRFLGEAARKGTKVFHLGGTLRASQYCRSDLPRQFPGLRIEAHHGYFNARRDSEENRAVLDKINAFGPHVLLVGMGMPRQELWIEQNRDDLWADVVCTLGGTIAYLAGEQATPPRWLGQFGLEGAYRFARDPRRLWARYLREPAGLIRPMADDLRRRRQPRQR